MDMTQIFMDEIEKVAIVGTPLGRMIKAPKARKMMATDLRESRAALPGSVTRTMLAGVRGGLETVPADLRSFIGTGEADTVLGPFKDKIMASAGARASQQGAHEIAKNRMTRDQLRAIQRDMEQAK